MASTSTPVANGKRLAAESGPVYVWTFPGAPFTVLLALDAVKRLAAEIEQLGREDRTADWFGVLLGAMPARRHEGLPVTEVVDYRIVRTWSDPAVRQRVTTADLPSDDRGLTVVGCVSIPANAGLQTGLTDEDVNWTSKCFTHPRQVVLSVERRLGACPLATFLIRESVGFLPLVLLEFPLSAQELQPVPETRERITDQRRTSTVIPASWRSQRALAAYATGVIGLGLIGWTIVNRRSHGPEQTSTTAAGGIADRAVMTSSPLNLRVEAAGQGLAVLWQPPASAEELLGGLLIVTENQRPLGHFALSPEQLQMGRLFFRPPADQLQLQLEVQTRSQGTIKEAVLAFLPGAAPKVEQPAMTGRAPELPATAPAPSAGPAARPAWLTKQIPVQQTPENPQRTSVNGESSALSTPRVEPSPSSTNSPVVSAYSPAPPPKPESILPPVSSAPIITAPAAVPERVAMGESALPPISTAPPPSAPVVKQTIAANTAAATAATTTAPPRVAGTLERYQPPSPLRSERPRLERKLWSKITREVTVEANLHIDRSGKITRVDMTPLPGDLFGRELNSMVKETVKTWRFKPAQIGDQAVEADHTIKFVFHPAQ